MQDLSVGQEAPDAQPHSGASWQVTHSKARAQRSLASLGSVSRRLQGLASETKARSASATAAAKRHAFDTQALKCRKRLTPAAAKAAASAAVTAAHRSGGQRVSSAAALKATEKARAVLLASDCHSSDHHTCRRADEAAATSLWKASALPPSINPCNCPLGNCYLTFNAMVFAMVVLWYSHLYLPGMSNSAVQTVCFHLPLRTVHSVRSGIDLTRSWSTRNHS